MGDWVLPYLLIITKNNTTMKQAAIAAIITAMKNDEKFVQRVAFFASQRGSEIFEDACDTIVTGVTFDQESLKEFVCSQFPGITINEECKVELNRGECSGIRVRGRLKAFRSEAERCCTYWWNKEKYSLEATDSMSREFESDEWHTFPLDFFPEELYTVQTL